MKTQSDLQHSTCKLAFKRLDVLLHETRRSTFAYTTLQQAGINKLWHQQAMVSIMLGT